MNLSFSSSDGTIYILFVILALPILILFPIVQKIISVVRSQKTLRAQTIIALYEAPQGLSPAEIGYMYDTKIGSKEIAGTLFDLEYRGLIGIDQRGALAVTNKIHEQLKPHEEQVLTLIRRNELNNITVYVNPKITHDFNTAVRAALIAQEFMNKKLFDGYFTKALKFTFFVAPSTMLLFSIVFLFTLGFPSLGEAIGFVLFFNFLVSIVAFPVYMLTGMLLTLMYVEIYGTHWIGTKKLGLIWGNIEGFKVYIKQAQLDRLQFTSQDLKQQSNERDYAYAVALGMDLDWQNRFSS